MERLEGGKKTSILARALEQCRSFGRPRGRTQPPNQLRRCRSWNDSRSSAGGRRPRTPVGYVAIYVGPEKERIVIKMECINHPFFKVLLDEAESVYGFTNLGPLELPCEVDRLYEVLYDIEYRAKVVVARERRRDGAATGYQQLRPSSFMVTACGV